MALMLYVVLEDLTIDVLPAASAVIPDDGTLTARDEEGRVVKTYERGQVIMFSLNEKY
jgi:hypothetical protein